MVRGVDIGGCAQNGPPRVDILKIWLRQALGEGHVKGPMEPPDLHGSYYVVGFLAG